MPDSRDEIQVIVNKKPFKWGEQFITGKQVKELAESPDDYVVNQIVPGPGADPEIKDADLVDVRLTAEPQGVKRFNTRKPTTTPGL